MKKASVSAFAFVLLAGQGFAQSVPCVSGTYTCAPINVYCDASANPSDCPAGLTPGSTALQTNAIGINASREVVGSYNDSANRVHGFLLSRGRFTSIDVPGAVITSANGIGPSGDIVGNYVVPYVPLVTDQPGTDPSFFCLAPPNAASCTKGFLYHRGQFSTVLFPGHPGAVPWRIEPDGTIYGCFHDTNLMLSMFGAVWGRFGNVSLAANGGEVADMVARPRSMNNGATPDGHMIVGLAMTPAMGGGMGPVNGFIVRFGKFESYHVAGSASTAIWDVNPAEQFVGQYVLGGLHGFLQNPNDPDPITIDFPGAAATVAESINAGGVIAGQYAIAGQTHGFLAVPAPND